MMRPIAAVASALVKSSCRRSRSSKAANISASLQKITQDQLPGGCENRLGMKLHAEHRPCFVANAHHRAIVCDPGRSHERRGQTIRRNHERVIAAYFE